MHHRGSFDNVVGHIGPDPKMVMIFPSWNLLPKPNLLQEIVSLLIKVRRLLSLGNDILFNFRAT